MSLNSTHKQTSFRLATTSWVESLTVSEIPSTVEGSPSGKYPPRSRARSRRPSRRAPITKQLVTGYSMIDTVLPIGKGQRQLLMGPIQSGTDAFCREVIRNQEDTDTVCIYASIGKPTAHVHRLAPDCFPVPQRNTPSCLQAER